MNSAPVDPADPSLLSAQAPALAAAFASVASDIALVIDAQGIVRHVALGQGSPGLAADGWVGKPWAETVTRDSRRKVELLLHEATAAGVSRRREVNHPGATGPDVPMAYAALRLGERGPVLAVGRDLRVAAALQQRFVDAQREVGRERWQLRRAQSRQRLLGQVAGDAVMVVDAKARAVIEANPAAGLLFGLPGAALPAAVDELLAATQRSRRATEIRTRIAGPGSLGGVGITQGLPVEMSAIALRTPAGAAPRLLVRARRAEAVDTPATSPDAVVITDAQGHILMASPAFLALCRAGSEAQLAGRALGDVLGDPQRRLAALLSDVLHDGIVNDVRIALGPNADGGFEALLGAALIADGSRECIGITLRRWDRPAAADLPGLRTQALAELLGRLGSLPLDELARRAGQLAEQHALEAALQHSGGDRGRAAALLGLSQPELEKRWNRFAHPSPGA